MASIKIRVAENGTCTIYRNGSAVCSGLTRAQADELVSVMRCLETGV